MPKSFLLPFASLVTLFCVAQATPLLAQCDLSTLGSPPLTDLGSGEYLPGYSGGLYPGGLNERPTAHEAAGLAIATGEIIPRDFSGVPDAAGLVGFISIGMSNTTQEFSTFLSDALSDPTLQPQLVIVDGAQGGQAVEDWIGGTQPWTVLASRLTAAGLGPNQVQVIWMKQANRNPGAIGTFPVHAESLRDDYTTIIAMLKLEFPNLRLLFLSSRTRAGVFDVGLNPEPFAYESGLSVRFTIEAQLTGDPALAYTGPNPVAPWLSWGPYLWTDGLVGRSDGLLWEQADLQPDCTHPNIPGRQKVADQLTAFLKTDTTARPWYLSATDPADAPTIAAGPTTISGGAPFTVAFSASATAANFAWTIDQFAWNFGDGCNTLGATPTKTFLHPGAHTVHLTVSDSAGHTATEIVTVTVDAGIPIVPTIVSPTSPLQNGVEGTALAVSFTATGTPPLTFSVTAGALPTGLTLEPSGLYHGTPTAAGSFAFTVTVTNTAGSGSAAFLHAIDPSAPGGGTVTLAPVADTYVRDGGFSGDSFGAAATLAVRSAGTLGQNTRAFLKFDLGGAPAPVTSAMLELRAVQLTGGPLLVSAHEVVDDTWAESSLTWDDGLAFGPALDSVLVASANTTIVWDVTPFIAAQLGGDGVVSLCLVAPAGSAPLAIFASKEGQLEPPRLVVTGASVVDPPLTRGDCNDDGVGDISDAVTLLVWLFPTGPAGTLDCLDACDANDDGALDVADAIAVLSSLFGAPAAPLPDPLDCGVDPTADGLECVGSVCP